MSITAGGNLNSTPATTKQTFATNYLDFTGTANSWGQQYLPDLMEKEAEVFGPRTISGFLSQVGAEEAMTSDQVVWSEQSRLHLSYTGNMSSQNVFTITKNIDGVAISGQTHGVRINDTVIIANANGVFKAIVVAISGAACTVRGYNSGAIAALTTANASTLLVYGSEYGKGTAYYTSTGATPSSVTTERHQANEPQFETFTNKPIIMKDFYEVSGSDASRIGWVEVSAENGQSGYLWYLKAEADTRARFTDYIEMAMLESEVGSDNDHNIGAPGQTGVANDVDDYLRDDADVVGTEGLFAAVEDRGNVTTGVTGVNAATDLAEFDAILAGFRRGSYDFYKSDFRYLNDKATRGGINSAAGANALRGVMIPAGTSSVYDQTVGQSMKRPFLHVRYRASQTDDRRLKTWVTGSVGAATSALDAMHLHFLTERCLITQGANNFMLMK
jgi:hypothetical protein